MQRTITSVLLILTLLSLLQSCAITGFEKRLYRSGFHISYDQRSDGLRMYTGRDDFRLDSPDTVVFGSTNMGPTSDNGSIEIASVETGAFGHQMVDTWTVSGADSFVDLNQPIPDFDRDTCKREKTFLGVLFSTGGLAALAGTTMLGFDIVHINERETLNGADPDRFPFILASGILAIIFGIATFILIKVLKRKGKPRSQNWRIGMVMAIIGLGLVGLSALTLIFYTIYSLFRSLFNSSS